jgi:hypothetical protein
VTLTSRHGSLPTSAEIRKARRSFGKLRHRKLWKKNVVAGVAAIEVTNDDGGWHPHLHAVVDCKWLAIKTPPPRRRDSPEKIRELCVAASTELSTVWAKTLGDEMASVRVKRAIRETITKEVVKYTIKGDDLITAPFPIGDMIRAIDGTRLMTTFGHAHGQCVKDIRAEAKRDARERRSDNHKSGDNPDESHEDTGYSCPCGDHAAWLPDEIFGMMLRKR